MFRYSQYVLRLYRQAGACPVPRLIRTASSTVQPAIIASQALPPSTVAPLQIKLREYQEECIQSVLSYLQAGHKRLGVSLATGSGKTVIFTHLIDRIPIVENGCRSVSGSRRPPASQTLILAHRRELVEQAARHCTTTYPDKNVEIEMGNKHASGVADITVASLMSITSGDRLTKFDPSRFKLVLVDEVHHIVSPTYLSVLEHFGLRHTQDWTTVQVPALVGVSATFSRYDGMALGTVIDHIVYHRDYVDMIEENWLSDVIFTTVEMKVDLNTVQSGANGDFQTGALSRVVNTDETNEIIVRAWLAKAKERKSTLVFCVDLSHVSNLTAKFRQYGVAAQFVTGDTPAKIRSARVNAFRNGEFPVLLNCGVFTEGTDIPNIDCVLLARPTKSRNLLVQMIGRGMRLHHGKENCHIIDMVSALSTGVVSSPTLFGLDPSEIVENVDRLEMEQLKQRREQEKEREEAATEVQRNTVARKLPGTLTFTDYDSVHDLIADTSGDQYIRRISEFAWVNAGDSKYVLATNSGNYLIIESAGDENEGYVVKYYRRLSKGFKSKSPYATPKMVARGESFEHIVHAADTFAADVFEYKFIARNQAWRRSPASQAQLDFLNKMRPDEDKLKPSDVTKGKAGDMITRFKHGARGKFDKASALKRAQQRTRERAETAKKRLQPQVRVGPLSGGS